MHTAAAFTLLLVAVGVAAGRLPAGLVTALGAVVLTTSVVSLAVYLQQAWRKRSGR
jgi:hypothetical protein